MHIAYRHVYKYSIKFSCNLETSVTLKSCGYLANLKWNDPYNMPPILMMDWCLWVTRWNYCMSVKYCYRVEASVSCMLADALARECRLRRVCRQISSQLHHRWFCGPVPCHQAQRLHWTQSHRPVALAACLLVLLGML